MSKVFESFLPDEDFPPEHELGVAWLQLQEIQQVATLVVQGATKADVLPSHIHREMYVRGVRTAETITVEQYTGQSKFDMLVKEPYLRRNETEDHIADAAAIMKLLRLFVKTGDNKPLKARVGLTNG